MSAEAIAEIEQLMLEALARRGLGGEDARFVVADFIGAQLAGKTTHGLGKFLLVDSALRERRGRPSVQRRRGGLALVDGHREIGQLAGRFCARLVADLARDSGVGLVGLTNAARFGRLEPYGRLIAGDGLVGVIVNNAGPPVVAPFGSVDPVLGTNPICFAFPGPPPGVVIDFSTGERVWGEIRRAVLDGGRLPPGAFLDGEGCPTEDPDAAHAVIAFGGHKGYALCMALELLAGTLAGARMGPEVAGEYDLGAVFLAADPQALGTHFDPAAGERLCAAIRASRPAPGHDGVAVPGDRSAARTEAAVAAGVVEVDTETMSRLREMARSTAGGLEPSRRLN